MPSPKSTTACSFCGRANDPSSRFCMDCGKPISASASRFVLKPAAPTAAPTATDGGDAGSGTGPSLHVPATRVVPPTRVGPASARCPRCGKVVDPTLPFCAHCGSSLAAVSARGPATCEGCGAPCDPTTDLFCSRCGHRVSETPRAAATRSGTAVLGARSREAGARVVVLDEAGEVKATYPIERGEAVIGRGEVDLRFDDPWLSPAHARLELRDGAVRVRDLGSRNGTWVFLDEPTTLADGDVLLVGSQLLRFRRLGAPASRPAEGDGTRPIGSLAPAVDVAVLEQLRADGSVRDCLHLSPGRSVALGRESGDWLFPYDQTMSGRHAEIRSREGEFVVHDTGSRNGVAIAVRGERTLAEGQRLLVGDQVLRVESSM